MTALVLSLVFKLPLEALMTLVAAAAPAAWRSAYVVFIVPVVGKIPLSTVCYRPRGRGIY